MSSTDIFNKNNLFKLFLIILSVIIWVYFYVSSKLSLDLLIIFDIQSIINTVFTFNFLLFLLFFPLPTIIIIAMSFNDNKKINIIQIIFSLLFATIISMIVFKLNYVFLIFFMLYLILHIIISIIASNKFNDNKEKKIISISNSISSIVAILFSVILFLIVFISILPDQKIKAEQMEIGIVNLFVGDDLSNWIGTSYSISRQCTVANVDYIMGSSQYRALSQNTNKESTAFVNYMQDLKEKNTKTKTDKEIMAMYPDLTADNIRGKVLETIKSIPLMRIIESNFAIIFAFLIVSVVYFYFWIAFLISSIFVVLFYNLFNIGENVENSTN